MQKQTGANGQYLDFPKGIGKTSESHSHAAIRGTLEETGLSFKKEHHRLLTLSHSVHYLQSVDMSTFTLHCTEDPDLDGQRFELVKVGDVLKRCNPQMSMHLQQQCANFELANEAFVRDFLEMRFPMDRSWVDELVPDIVAVAEDVGQRVIRTSVLASTDVLRFLGALFNREPFIDKWWPLLVELSKSSATAMWLPLDRSKISSHFPP
jgi:8-oxo-dGTP pyrophosphatase MutT (NUDIX family)